MLNITDFAKCIRTNLKDKRYGKERADEIIKGFEERAQYHISSGRSEVDASALAMKETFDSMSKATAEKAKRTAKQLSVQAETRDVVAEGLTIDTEHFATRGEGGTRGSRGKALAHAVMSRIAADPRFKGPRSYETRRDLMTKRLYGAFGDALEPIRKGAYGRQHGKAHLDNIVREIRGADTGDKIAKNVAVGFRRMDDMSVDEFNLVGGSLTKLKGYFPQPIQNIPAIIKLGERKFIDANMQDLDWDSTRWPNGSKIDMADREGFLKEVYNTQSSDGANKIDDTKMRGQGRAMGNMLDQHRLLHYKDGDAWLRMHELYGDGNVLDVINHHISNSAHHIAAVNTFGPNPDLGFKNMMSIARKAALDAGISHTQFKQMDSILQNKVQDMFDISMRKNPLNTEGFMAATTTSVTNVLTSAYLGGSSVPAFFGDHATAIVVNKFNGMPALGGMSFYLKAMTYDQKFQRKMQAQTGWMSEQNILYLNGAERFNPLITMGDKYSRFAADSVMRFNLNTFHTTNARWKFRAEFMSFFHTLKDKEFGELPIVDVMKRYGINEKDWNDFRAGVKPYSPRTDVNMLSPAHIFDTTLKNKQELYEKFAGMITEEANIATPMGTTEARVMLKGKTRPDTLVGVMLHSFSTFKNFPASYLTMLSRRALFMPRARTRLGYYVSVVAMTTVGGLMAAQVNELRHGRTFMPLVDENGTPNFKLLLKAFLIGGGSGVWGDFLYGATNAYGQGHKDVIAGPFIDIAGDVLKIFGADIPKDVLSLFGEEDYDSKTLEHLVSLGRKVQPGANAPGIELIGQRMFWDAIQDIVDPEAANKRYRKEGRREEDYGNEYWWHLGEKFPEGLN